MLEFKIRFTPLSRRGDMTIKSACKSSAALTISSTIGPNATRLETAGSLLMVSLIRFKKIAQLKARFRHHSICGPRSVDRTHEAELITVELPGIQLICHMHDGDRRAVFRRQRKGIAQGSFGPLRQVGWNQNIFQTHHKRLRPFSV